MSSPSPVTGSRTGDRKTPPARARILDAAGPLFYRKGFRAVGIDRVIAEAGVAKATFYNHFPSKDDLIVAWIERAEGLTEAAAPPDDTPTPLTDYANAMIDVAAEDRCLGCTFQVSASEFSDPAHPAHAAAMQVKRRVLAELTRRAGLQGVDDPEAIAAQVFLLIEGVWASVRMFGRAAPLAAARAALARLAG